MIRRCLLLWLVSTSLVTSSSAAVFTVTTDADSGAGSLRQAILDANANPGADAIHFNIAGGGPIVPTSELPDVTDAVTIDGTTQPGFAGTPIITLVGQNAGPADGLTIASPAPSTVRGLAIIAFTEAGIEVSSDGARIVGNYIGVNASGAVAQGNSEGIRVVETADGTVIGGPAAGDRNVISGNGTFGIRFSSAGAESADGNIVQGNFIGVDATGTFALANLDNAIEITGGLEKQAWMLGAHLS